MSTILEDIDNLSSEEILGPPKYDGVGILMVSLTALIVGSITGIIVMLLVYLVLGRFTIESGASPILLVFVTFISLTLGNLLYYAIVSRIFPNIYSRGRTSLSQITILSIILYILFIPVYLIIAGITAETNTILIAFSAHVVINNFSLTVVLGIISQYRYSLLAFYAGIIGLVITTSIVIFTQSQVSATDTSKTLFILLGLAIISYTLSGTLASVISWIYYRMYLFSGYDPIGSVFGRIENDERILEKRAENELTHFSHKK